MLMNIGAHVLTRMFGKTAAASSTCALQCTTMNNRELPADLTVNPQVAGSSPARGATSNRLRVEINSGLRGSYEIRGKSPCVHCASQPCLCDPCASIRDETMYTRWPTHVVHRRYGTPGLWGTRGAAICPTCLTRWRFNRDNSVEVVA